MHPHIAEHVSGLVEALGGAPADRLRTPSALLMGVAIFTVVFATLWLMAARRRVRGEPVRPPRRRGRPPEAWSESARRLRLPPDDNLSDDDTRDIDPSDLSPGDVDLRRAEDDDEPSPGEGKGPKR